MNSKDYILREFKKQGVTSRDLQRILGIKQSTASMRLKKIDKSMRVGVFLEMLKVVGCELYVVNQNGEKTKIDS